MKKTMDSFAIFLLENLGFKLLGFKPKLMKNIVERLGGFRSLRWFVANMFPARMPVIISTITMLPPA
jgi:hypothetical protein